MMNEGGLDVESNFISAGRCCCERERAADERTRQGKGKEGREEGVSKRAFETEGEAKTRSKVGRKELVRVGGGSEMCKRSY